MNINKIKETIINISLFEKEAKGLKEVMQNPRYDNEDERDRQMRKALWEGLDSAGILN